MPIINRNDFQLSDYIQYSRRYAIFSTHIAYKLEFCDDVTKEKQTINLPACHTMPHEFINENSIYHYTFKEFKDFIYDLHNSSQTIIDALKNNGFREANWNFSKDHAIRTLTIGDLKSDENLMKEIFDLLRHVMNFPIPKLSTPYDSAHYRYQRKIAMIERLKQTLPSTVVIDSNEDRIRYKGVDGYVTIEDGKIYTDEERYKSQHNNKTAVKFPFIFEIMIVPIIECTDTFFANQIYENGVIFIGGLNYSTTPTGTGSEYFEVHERDPYSPWMFNYKGKEGDSLLELLQKCGFVPGWKIGGHDSSIDETRQKQPCIVIAHLVTPKPKYVAGYGKSHIDLRPYASTIAKTTIELVNRIPSKVLARKRLLASDPIIHYLRMVIKKRWEYIKSRAGWKRGDLSILDVDPWTQSTVWYGLREEYLIPYNVPINSTTRDYVTSSIRDVCAELEKDWIVAREEVGIIAGARASMFFDGQWMNIDMDKIVDMAGLARYQVYIEKRGGVEVLIRFIGDYGAAFVNTQGHFVEYAKDLARAAKISGSHITIVTDSDCAGINIAEKVMMRSNENDEDEDEDDVAADVEDDDCNDSDSDDNHIERLGIDPVDTRLYFGISEERWKEMEEEYPIKRPDPKTGKPRMSPGRNVTSPLVRMYNKYQKYPRKYSRYQYIADSLGYLIGKENLRIMASEYKEDPVKFQLYRHVYENLDELTANAPERAKRVEIDRVIKEVGPAKFSNFILDMLQVIFPESDVNRSIKRMKEYFGEKFGILPPETQKLFIHIVSLAEAAAESTEDKIEEEQKNLRGFLQKISDKKQENNKRIAKAVAVDPEMRSLSAVFKLLNKHIPEYFDLDHLRNVAQHGNLKLTTVMHLEFIKHHGTKEQKQRMEKAETKADIEAIYKEVLKDIGQRNGASP